MAGPVGAVLLTPREETQINVAVGWLVYCTVATAVWARLRREVDGWLMAHYALVVLGVAVLGVVIQAQR